MDILEVIIVTTIVSAFVGMIMYQLGNVSGWHAGFKEAKRIWSGDYHE